eukprot:COSAG01_NODE_12211_length_1779_cov_1.357143_1_plen_39_part_10
MGTLHLTVERAEELSAPSKEIRDLSTCVCLPAAPPPLRA